MGACRRWEACQKTPAAVSLCGPPQVRRWCLPHCAPLHCSMECANAPLCTKLLLSCSLSARRVVNWLPRRRAMHPPRAAGDALIFVSWEHQSELASARFPQRLGVVYCFNRPCSLQVVPWPQQQAEAPTAAAAVCITRQLSSAFSPRFSPDGSTLVFLSQQNAVASGVHNATTTLHSLRWADAQAALGGGMAPPPRTGALPAPGRNAAGRVQLALNCAQAGSRGASLVTLLASHLGAPSPPPHCPPLRRLALQWWTPFGTPPHLKTSQASTAPPCQSSPSCPAATPCCSPRSGAGAAGGGGAALRWPRRRSERRLPAAAGFSCQQILCQQQHVPSSHNSTTPLGLSVLPCPALQLRCCGGCGCGQR